MGPGVGKGGVVVTDPSEEDHLAARSTEHHGVTGTSGKAKTEGARSRTRTMASKTAPVIPR